MTSALEEYVQRHKQQKSWPPSGPLMSILAYDYKAEKAAVGDAAVSSLVGSLVM